ncbi:putative DNA-binding domain-containing protein [Marinobacter hydrocarbonoclasticus]|nr:putative DNA-binding domain-containing protein [Marinobacter nauticus]
MSDFTQLQQSFIDYIRAPQAGTPPPGTDARHMAVYRELFFNNVSGFVSNGFPVLKSLHSEARWQERLRDFFARHDCHSPLFVDIARAFLDYLETQDTPDFPFEQELAQYEYLELWVDTQEPVEDQPCIAALNEDTPLVRYRASALGTYDYPVQQVRADAPWPEPQPTFLVVFREGESEVRFTQLNPMTMQLLLLIDEQPGITPAALETAMVSMLPQLDPAVVREGMMTVLSQLAQRGVVRQHKK